MAGCYKCGDEPSGSIICLISGTVFGKKVAEHKTSVLIFSTTLSKIFHILRRTGRDIVINVKTPLCKVPIILVGF
jgi:hypothetical protein